MNTRSPEGWRCTTHTTSGPDRGPGRGRPSALRRGIDEGVRAPELTDEALLEIEQGWHPVVKASSQEPFVPNDLLLCDDRRMLVEPEDATANHVYALADGEDVVIAGIMQHIEEAGIHSGDSFCVLPPYSLSPSLLDEIKYQVKILARRLNVCGLMNVQFAIKGERVYVLEANPRASRTVPFVSKAIGVPLAKLAAKVMTGLSLESLGFTEEIEPKHFAVKEAVLKATGSGLTVPVREVVVDPDPDRPPHMDAIAELAARMGNGEIETLLILGGNPVYDAPAELDFGGALARVETSVRLGLYRDETSRACTWHLPRAHFLESWGDVLEPAGRYSVVQPLIAPLLDGRTPAEVANRRLPAMMPAVWTRV